MNRHAYGLLPDTHDQRDLRFSLVANDLGLLDLPRSVDLRPLCSPVRDQGALGSCTGQALIGFRECLLTQAKQFTALSPLYIYYWERSLERSIQDDAGAQIRDGMRVLRKLGAAPEPDWPYDIAKFRDRPSQEATDDAAAYRIQHFHRINNAVEIKQALCLGAVPPKKYLGGHAVAVVGYNDDAARFLVRNSWGTGWAMAGYFTLPYAFFRPALGLVTDLWTGSV